MPVLTVLLYTRICGKQEILIKLTIDDLIFAGISDYHHNERKTMFETGCHHLLKLET